jgi:hypothetical protein
MGIEDKVLEEPINISLEEYKKLLFDFHSSMTYGNVNEEFKQKLVAELIADDMVRLTESSINTPSFGHDKHRGKEYLIAFKD